MCNKRRMTDKERMLLNLQITEELARATTREYAIRILESKRDEEDEEGMTFRESVVEDVLTTSAWEEEGYYSLDDIRLAIGREFIDRLSIQY